VNTCPRARSLQPADPPATRPTQVINEALRKWVDSRKEAKRYDVYDARQRLEQQWGDGDGSDSSGGGGGEDGGSSGGRGGGGL
jgi:uncharacterized membrane protein YgcG